MILFFTMISPFPYIAWGGAASYILASMVLLTDFRLDRNALNARVDLFLIRAVLCASLVILVLGAGILMEESTLVDVIQNYYQSFSEELYEQMVTWNSKPVTVFGSHSTAAFAYFSLFALNFKISENKNLPIHWRIVHFSCAIGFVVLNWFLASNTSVAMAILMFVFIAAKPAKLLSPRLMLVVLPWIMIFILIIAFDLNLFQAILGDSEENGFLARYTAGGRLQSTYDYLAANYFAPIGFSYSPELGLGDNFIAEYIVKTSPLGYLIILCLLWGWFRRHLDLRQAVAFFVFFLLADLAYPLLVYSRIAAVLPFYVLIWQRLSAGSFLKKTHIAPLSNI